jgi:[1-hydroxy-2-(trimethylamino)ethyl]phosphonate dioxygenase
MNMIDNVLKLFATRGDSQYGGEAVSQLAHALQAADFAEREQAPISLIVAALLHDIGHLLHALPNDAPDHGVDDRHETIAGQFLEKHFHKSVTEPVRLHVAAKRYLCAVQDDYLNQLSAASLLSLRLQGGPMTPDEIAEFRSSPYAMDAVRLRHWDDEAKDPTRITPPISHFVRYIQEVLVERETQ